MSARGIYQVDQAAALAVEEFLTDPDVHLWAKAALELLMADPDGRRAAADAAELARALAAARFSSVTSWSLRHSFEACLAGNAPYAPEARGVEVFGELVRIAAQRPVNWWASAAFKSAVVDAHPEQAAKDAERLAALAARLAGDLTPPR